MISIRLEDPDGAPLPPARPGQYLTLRIQPDDEQRSLLRNYSLCGPPDAGYYRIAVKREPTAPPAAISTPGSPSATSSTSPPRAAPSSSTGRTHRCC